MSTTRIYSLPAAERRRTTPNALDVPNRFMVNQMCWHYRQLRRRNVDTYTARNTIWQMAWMASMASYRPTFVSWRTIRPAWPAPDPTNLDHCTYAHPGAPR